MKVWIAHEQGLPAMGRLPRQVRTELYAAESVIPPSDPSDVEFWVPPFLGAGPSAGLLAKMSQLRVVQLMTAGAEAWIGRLPDRVTLCDARGVHDSSTSEWVVAAILAHLRDFPAFIRAQERRRWAYHVTDELAGKRVLLIGAGSIGAALTARLEPFEVEVTKVARTARPGVHGVDELPRLLPDADVVVLLVPLTPQTTRMVDARFLAAMPPGSLLVNAARGPVVDTDALTAELTNGRIAAALDVTEPEPLPSTHPLWRLPNVLLTPHVGGSVRGFLPRAYRLIGDQIRRYAAGEPLINVVENGY